MADLLASNLLTDSFLTKGVQQIIMDSNQYIGKNYLPTENTTSNTFKVRINKNNVKPIGDVAGKASSPVRNIRGQELITYEGISFKSKIVYTTDDAEYLKILQYIEGFKNVSVANRTELVSLQSKGEELANAIMQDASLAVESGLEKARWQALTGSLVTDNHGTIDYNFANGRKPTAGVVWSTSATATPVANLRAWKQLFRASGYKPAEIVMNQATFDEMVNSSEVKSYLSGTNESPLLMTEGNVTRVLGMPIRIYDEFYDTSTDPNTASLTPYIPNDKVFILGANKFGDPSLGRFYLGPTVENNNQSGVYVKMLNLTQSDPQQIEIRFGFKGLPSLFFDDGDGVVYAGV